MVDGFAKFVIGFGRKIRNTEASEAIIIDVVASGIWCTL